MVNLREVRRQAVFGGADGVTLVVGLIFSLGAVEPHAVVRAALGAGLAELVGMTAGQWLSDSEAGFGAALANGGAAFLACLVPALPYLATSNVIALAASLVLVVAVAGLIALLRPEKGTLAVVQTYGVLAIAALLCWAASLI